MQTSYLGFKFAHIFLAIASLGTGAALAILTFFFGHHPAHGAFVLRTVRKLAYAVFVPGYVLMLVTGMWMGHIAGLLDARWTEAAMNLWGLGALFVASALVALQRQIRRFEAEGPANRHFRLAWYGRVGIAGAAAVIVAILWLMVFKPA
jgi:uncharacterized membrane protein